MSLSQPQPKFHLHRQSIAPIPGKLLDIRGRRILQIGFGGIGNCMIPLYKRHFIFDPLSITVIDMKEHLVLEGKKQHKDIAFVHDKVTKQNYQQIFSTYLRAGDMLVDLAWYIDTLEELIWCHKQDVMYINAAVEWWEIEQASPQKDPREYTLYARQLKIQEKAKEWSKQGYPGATAILAHGANPGWVSHTTKWALADWVQWLSSQGKTLYNIPSSKLQAMINAANAHDWPKVAQLLNVQVIHVSERDTLISNRPKERNEFICTWSPQGFIEEGMAPAELGWGTHETLSRGVYKYNTGPRHQVCLATRGMNTLVQTYVPSGNYVGMVVRHEEAYSISEYLTVHDNRNKAIYRPTVHYAYYPCSDAIASMYELQSNAYKEPERERIPKRELIEGQDELGCFLLSRDYGAWWIGTLQSVADAEKLLPNQGPTVLVVAAGVLGSVIYAFKHPNMGVIHAEAMDEDETMSYIIPYLQPFVSGYVEGWRPFVTTQFDSDRCKIQTKDWTLQRLLASNIAAIPCDRPTSPKRSRSPKRKASRRSKSR